MVVRDYRNEVRWWRENTWIGCGGGGVGDFGEVIEKNEEKWNNWIVFRVSKSYNQQKNWLTHHNEKRPFPSLSTASNFDKGRKGNPKHKIMGRTYKPNQRQCLKCFCNLWQFFSALIARQESVKRK